VKKEVAKSNSIAEIKNSLLKRGFLESDVDDELRNIISSKSLLKNKNNRILSIKEFLDRIGYGFASQQFVNILFMLSGASLLLIGLINGLKSALSQVMSGFLNEYSHLKYIGKNIISASGIIFGFSFLGMALSVVIQNPALFTASMLIGTLGIIAHGDLYTSFFNRILKNEKRKDFLKFISYFGILITAGSLLLAGFVLEIFPINGQVISFNPGFLNLAEPMMFKLYGYLLAFEVTAIMFIISGYLLSFLDEEQDKLSSQGSAILDSFRIYVKNSLKATSIFAKNKKTFLLTIATILTTIAQIIGNSYYGIFIYENFKNEFLKGFLNVSVIFVIAIIASISGTLLTKKFAKSLGEAPMLVFGTLLIALMPITFYFNPQLYAIGLATALSVIGGAIVGVAQGLIAERLMDEDELRQYYSSLGFVSALPILLIVAVGAIIVQATSMSLLFLVLGIMLACIVMPLYFVIVLIVDKEYRKQRSQR
jgi:MFS family permease